MAKEVEIQTLQDRVPVMRPHSNLWMWVVCILILCFAAGTIFIIIIGLDPQITHPEEVDVVLYEYQSSPGVTVTSRLPRHLAQIHGVRKYMSWVRKIYVLSAVQDGFDESLGVTFVQFSGDLPSAFAYMPQIPEIAEHAIFLGDMTFPCRIVSKSFFYSVSGPRVFNIFRDQSEVDFFQSYLELPTMPVAVLSLKEMGHSPSWQDTVFSEVTEEKIVLYNEMNRDVMINGAMTANAQKQFKILTKYPPVFVTFHVNANQVERETANALIVSYLETAYVV